MHKRSSYLSILLALLIAIVAPTLHAQNLDGWTLTFQDEFNGTTLDTSKWNTCYEDQGPGTTTPCTLSGNTEMELYTQTGQTSEANGVLTIRGDKSDIIDSVTQSPYHYKSGMISSWGKFSQTHGYFEMRAKLPPGIGMFPAFWMDNDNHEWPPELDIMEMIGTTQDAPHVASIVSKSETDISQFIYTFDTTTAYHTYGLEWDATTLTYYFDGQAVAQVPAASDMTNPMQIMANLAIGASWPGNPTPYTVFPAYMNIDYIRAWTRNDPAAVIPYTNGQDVGSAGLAGTTKIETDGTATIKGAGAGFLTYASDSFQYAAQPLPGDGDFVMKVASVPAPNGSFTPETGVMVRQSMNADAPYVAIILANGKCLFQARNTPGAVTTRVATVAGISYPAWLRLIRKDDAYSGYVSTDGIVWTAIGTTSVDLSSATMGGSLLIGAAVSSGDPTSYNTASISNFNMPAVQITQDNADPSGVKIVGSWIASTTNIDYYGTNYLSDGAANKGGMSVTFTPTIPTTATYDVYFRWEGNELGRDTHVPVTINASDGAHTVYVNQQHQGSEWVFVGSYPFSAGATGNVEISNTGTTAAVSVDAVRFVPGPSTPALAATLPSAPTGVNTIATPDAGQVTLGWTPTPLADSYNILRATTSAGPFTTIATAVPISLTQYNDTTAAANTLYYYEVAAVNDSGQGAVSAPVAGMASILIDNGGATQIGTWSSSTSALTFYQGADYLTDGDTGGGKSVTYTPTIPVAGNYAVYMRYAAAASRADNVPVDIKNSSSTNTVIVNEKNSDNIWWYPLGTYYFPAGKNGSVVIRNDGADGYVIADAVEFIPLPGSVVVEPDSSMTTVVPSPATVAYGASETLTATVAGTTGTTGTPTGNVTFINGSTMLGTETLSSGVATLNTTTLPSGPQTITAVYSGDINFATSTSSSVTVTVGAQPPDFAFVMNSTAGTVIRGDTATSPITVTSAGGFAQQVTFTCSGLPQNVSCSFSPANVDLGSSASGTTTFTVKTDSNIKTSAPAGPQQPVTLAFLGGGLFSLMLLRARKKSKMLWQTQIALAILLLVSSVVGCGESVAITPSGNYNVTLTGTAGAITHSTTYNLIVE